MKTHVTFRSRGAFTLIESLTVIMILALIIAIATPAMLGAIRASRLTSAGELLTGKLVEAQGLALTFSSDVELRFYKSPIVKPTDGSSGQTLQLLQWTESDPTSTEGSVEQEQNGQDIAILKKIGAAEVLPDGVAISDNNIFSTLWNLKSKTEQTVEGEREYVAIRFRPDGSTDLDETEPKPWCLTLVAQNELEAVELPDNFYTVQIDPVTARLDVFRPE